MNAQLAERRITIVNCLLSLHFGTRRTESKSHVETRDRMHAGMLRSADARADVNARFGSLVSYF